MRLDSPNVVGTLTLDVVNNDLGDVLTVTSNVVTKRTIAQFLNDLGGVPLTRSILAGTGLTGGGSLSVDRTLSLTGQALSFHNLNTTGIVVRTAADSITTRTLVAGNNINITNPDGVDGNPVISLADSTFTQDEQVFDYAGSANFTLVGVTTPYNVEVYLNGQRLVKTLDWTIAGNVVTVTAPLDTVLPDEIVIKYQIKVPDTAPIGLSGSGTTNYVTKWGTSSTLTASTILDNGSLVDIQNNLKIGTSLSTISYTLPLSINLPTAGTKAAFLNIGVNSIVKVFLHGSENGFYQPITLIITRNSVGNSISIIKDNPFLHTHSNDVLFSADTATGDIFAEKTLSTTRPFRISKVEILYGTATVLNGSTTTAGTGVDQSITRVGAALYVTGVNTVAQGTFTATSLIRSGGTSTQFLKADGSVDSNTYGLSTADITAVSLTTTTLTLTRSAGNLTASVPTWNQNTTGTAAGLSSTLIVSSGGTGATTLTGIIVGNGTSAMTAIVGTASQLLRRNAGNTAYEFFTHDFVNQAGARSAISLTTTGTSGVATYSSSTGVLNIPNYTYTHPAYTTRSITATGASVLSTFTSDATGHVTGITIRTLTAADIGAAASSHTHAASAITAGTFGSGNYVFPANLEIQGQINSPLNAKGNSGTGTVTFNWNDANIQTVTLTGNCTFAFSNPQSGANYQIIIIQDTTGSRTITWPTIKWQAGSAPALTGTANSIDVVTLLYDGTSYYGTISKGHA